jgi:hypothetical protein
MFVTIALAFVAVVAVVVIVVLILASRQPDSFRVERKTKVNADAGNVFPCINDFHNWAAWSPFEKLDPQMKKTFSGAASGKGAVYEWDGNSKAGTGRMEIVESSEPINAGAGKVTIKLDYLKPFEGHNTSEFTMSPQGHGMAVDSRGFVYIGQNTVRKYDPKTGKVVGATPRAPETETGGTAGAAEPDLPPHTPGRGSAGPVAGFITPAGGRGRADSKSAAAREAEIAAFRAKYPPTTPMIVGGIEEIRLDEAARELYAADNYLGGRVMVFDLDTLQFKRGWGAYGHALSEISTKDADRAYTPGGPMPKEFRGHLTLNISNDGLVYAADRNANRIHVTTKQGKFVKEFILAPTTGVGGSTGGVMFSPDKQQRLLYISDLTNNHIWFLNRENGKVVGQMGSMGENAGQFYGLHMIAVDSKGTIYTGEVFGGERVQRFVPVK